MAFFPKDASSNKVKKHSNIIDVANRLTYNTKESYEAFQFKEAFMPISGTVSPNLNSAKNGKKVIIMPNVNES
jgi:hypothetical protein